MAFQTKFKTQQKQTDQPGQLPKAFGRVKAY
jgi:hypothetical protein